MIPLELPFEGVGSLESANDDNSVQSRTLCFQVREESIEVTALRGLHQNPANFPTFAFAAEKTTSTRVPLHSGLKF